MRKRVPVLKDGKVLRDENGKVLEFDAVNQEELDRKIDAPQVAQVGEVLTVEEVDAEGKPKKWKTALAAAEQVQADWNQNDETAADYVKNRPGGYYAKTEKIVAEHEISASGSTQLVLTVGVKYTAKIGEETWEMTAQTETVEEEGERVEIVYIGTNTFADIMAGTVENYWYIGNAQNGVKLITGGGKYLGAWIVITTKEDALVKIPEEMLALDTTQARITAVTEKAEEADAAAKKSMEEAENAAKISNEAAEIANNAEQEISGLLNTRKFGVEKYRFVIGQKKYAEYGYAINRIDNDNNEVELLNILPTGITFGNATDADYAQFGPKNITLGAFGSTSYVRLSVQNQRGGTDYSKIEIGDYESDHSVSIDATGRMGIGTKLLVFDASNIEEHKVTLRGVKTPEQEYDAANKKYVDRRLPSPATAQVGQIVKVKSVDESGKITETETVDMPSQKALKWVTVHSSDLTETTRELIISTDTDGKSIADYNPVGLSLIVSTPADATVESNNGAPWIYPSTTKLDNVIRVIGSISGWKTIARDSVFVFNGGSSAMSCTGNVHTSLPTYKLDGYVLDGVRIFFNITNDHLPVGTHVEVAILCEVKNENL